MFAPDAPQVAPPSNVLTVFHAPGLRKAKRWSYDPTNVDEAGNPEPLWVEGYETGDAYMLAEQRTVASIREAFNLLRELQHDPHRFLVWGALRDAADAAAREGVSAEDRRKGYTYRPGLFRCARVYLKRQPLNLVMFDVDKLPINAPIHGEASARAAIAALRDRMPEPFRCAACVAQFSGSSGHPTRPTNVLGVHLFFWLRHAADVEQLKRWMLAETSMASELNADPRVFQEQQPIYTSGPVKLDWMPDLLGLEGARVLLVEGDTDVVDMAPLPTAIETPEVSNVGIPDDEDDTCGQSDDEITAYLAKRHGADLWRANEVCEAVAAAAAHYGTSGRSEVDYSRAEKILWAVCGNVTQTLRIMHAGDYARPDEWAAKDNWIVRGCLAKLYAKWLALPEDRKRKAPTSSVVEFGIAAAAAAAGQEAAPVHGRLAPVPLASEDSYATREQQMEMFQGCVLIANNDGGDPVVLMPSGSRLKRRQFEAKFAGPDFLLGGVKNRPTDSAWEAFTRNQDVRFPRVDRPAFRPMDPFQTIYTVPGGETEVNTYIPRGEFKEGDPAPFVEHLAKILPNGDDAAILTSYLAACVQYPGVKFTWAVVLVSAAEGTGKGLIGRIMATALGREYVKQPPASKLQGNFNAWVQNALFVAVNDMPAAAPEALLEALKPMITDGEGAMVEGKGTNQISADVYANWLFTSNHKDGVRKTANDRRYCMLYCAQNDPEDLVRDGMGEAYFTRLVTWLHKEGGRAIAANYLKRFPIPEKYDPTRGAVRAPTTSSTGEALQAGRDEVTQILADSVADQSAGFKNGWVAHSALAALASGLRNPPSRVKVARTLEAQGYVRCPSLVDGRTNDPVPPMGIKTILWVRKGSETLKAIAGKTASEVQRMYLAAQAEKHPANASESAGYAQSAGCLSFGRQ
jgi:hypothetical protein